MRQRQRLIERDRDGETERERERQRKKKTETENCIGTGMDCTTTMNTPLYRKMLIVFRKSRPVGSSKAIDHLHVREDRGTGNQDKNRNR